MVKFILLALVCNPILTYSQSPLKIDVKLGKLTCRFRNDLQPSANAAFKLMSMVYSSQEFQDSVRKLSFPDNSCNNCGMENTISGDDILKTLFAEPQKIWNLVIKRSSGALGKTKPRHSYTIAYYNNITGDMCNLSFSVGLAVNLCHEYMHHICFCHPKDPKDVHWRKPSNGESCDDEKYDPVNYTTDVAYRIGWITYDILLKWYKDGKLKGYQ